MSNPIISTLISKRHVIWWVCPILQYSQPLPSDRSTYFLQLSLRSALPIFFVLASEGLATPGRPCGQASQMDPWHLARWPRVPILVFFNPLSYLFLPCDFIFSLHFCPLSSHFIHCQGSRGLVSHHHQWGGPSVVRPCVWVTCPSAFEPCDTTPAKSFRCHEQSLV